jgi:hypothetical protein
MTTPFETLKLARRLEAAGFPAQQAGDTAEAIAEALSNLVIKDDLRHEIELVRRDTETPEGEITIRFSGMLLAATGLILTALAIEAGSLARLIH